MSRQPLITRILIGLVWVGMSCLPLLLQSTAAAQELTKPVARHDHEAEKSRGHVTPGEAARRAQRINGGGRVLSVSRGHGGYRVKLIKNGEVRVVFIPGE